VSRFVAGLGFNCCCRGELYSAEARDRCYDFKNIFAEYLAKKLVLFAQNKAKF
jgi:hypothetical protein